MDAKESSKVSLGSALLAAGLSVIGIAFVGGCVYGILMAQGPVHTPFGVHPKTDTYIGGPLLLGFMVAVMTLPATFVLTFGIGFPLFYFWRRLGYSSVAAYVGGGVIIALIGELVIAAAHILAGFLLGGDFLFAMLLIAVSGPVAGFVVWRVLRRSFVTSSS